MQFNQFCNKVFDIAPTFTILNSTSSITARKLFNRQVHITENPLNILRLPCASLPSQTSVLQDVVSNIGPSSLTDLKVVDIITKYKSDITLNNCPFLFFNQQRYGVLKREENEYDHIQIVAMSKKTKSSLLSFLFLNQLDDDTTFIATLKLPKVYNYAGVIYNDLCETLLSDQEDDDKTDFSWITDFISWYNAQTNTIFALQ